MKRFSLIFLLVALFVCAFAITVSAVEIPQWPDAITELEGMPDKATFGDDGTKGATSRVLMDDGVAYPAYYICKDSTTLGISFSDIKSKSGIDYAAANVVRIELPNGMEIVSDALKVANGYKNLVTVVIPEGVTTIGEYAFKAVNTSTNSNLVSVTIPSTVRTIQQQAFHCCNSLVELIIPEGVEDIPTSFAYYATSLKTVSFPSTLKTIGDSAFRSTDLSDGGVVLPEGLTTVSSFAFKGSKATSVVVPSTLTTIGEDVFMECASLKSVVCKCPDIQAEMFSKCPLIESITLENTVTIGNDAFYSTVATPLKSLVLPDTLTKIGNLAFCRAGITELVVPASVIDIGDETFKECRSLKRVVMLGSTMGNGMFLNCSSMTELVLTSKFETYGSSGIAGVSQESFTTFYTGSDYDRIKTLMSDITRVSSAKFSTYESYLAGTHTQYKFIFIYDTDLCEVVYDGHLDDGNACIINCTRCGVSGKAERNPVHAEAMVLNYTSFDKDGTKDTVCTNPGCAYKVEGATAEALFVYIGHSAPEFIDGGMAIGYTINNSAIEEYEKAMGKTVVYGVFAVLEKRLEGDEIINPDETGASGVVHANVSKAGFSAFELKITGFKTDEQKAAKIIFGAYVITSDGNGAEVSYMQSGEPEAGKKYYSVSYSDIVG